MNNYIKILFFVVFIFLLNILLYFFSEDYKFFIKKIKTPNENIYVNNKNINDDFSSWLEDNEDYKNMISEKKNKILEEKNKNLAKNILNKSLENEKKQNIVERKAELEQKVRTIMEDEEKKLVSQEIYLWKTYLEVLDLFKSYDSYKIKIHTSLFDLTSEYPNDYFEFYSDKLTIYFFPIGSYKKMYEIFNVLTYDLPFSIKEVNNFWDKSFYINLDEEVSDDYIRFVITNKWILFWLKVRKGEYDNIKKILDTNL